MLHRKWRRFLKKGKNVRRCGSISLKRTLVSVAKLKEKPEERETLTPEGILSRRSTTSNSVRSDTGQNCVARLIILRRLINATDPTKITQENIAATDAAHQTLKKKITAIDRFETLLFCNIRLEAFIISLDEKKEDDK